MTAQVEFFFDCSSPWTYLGLEALVKAAEEDGFGIVWRPFLVGGVFNTVNPSVYEMRSKPVVPKELAARILKGEHWAYPRAVTADLLGHPMPTQLPEGWSK